MDNECADVFRNRFYKRASELLPKVRDPSNVVISDFSPEKHKHIQCNRYSVTLLHLAAYHGWIDICDQLITKYKCDPRV